MKKTAKIETATIESYKLNKKILRSISIKI